MSCPGYCAGCGCNPDSWRTDSVGRVWCETCEDRALLALVPPAHPELRAAIKQAIDLARAAGLTGDWSVEQFLENALTNVEPRAKAAAEARKP